MPFKSTRQQAFFQLCKSNPSAARRECPDEKTLDEYLGEARKRTSGRLDAMKGKLKRERKKVQVS
ncbi:MAG: hypothetical protein ACR2P5_05985 [Gammaproteobacteria bacterium]